MLVARLTLKDWPERRAMPRQSAYLPVQIITGTGAAVEVSLRNLSANGFLIDADLDLPVGAIIGIEISGATLGDARVVRRVSAQYGCEFVAVRNALHSTAA